MPARQNYPIDNKTLAIIEVVVLGLLEAKRYQGWKKTGTVSGGSTQAACCLSNRCLGLISHCGRAHGVAHQCGRHAVYCMSCGQVGWYLIMQHQSIFFSRAN